MTLETNPLLKRSPRSFYRFITVRRIAFILVIIVLMSLAIYNYLTITQKQFIEYQAILRSHLGEKEDQVPRGSMKLPRITEVSKISTLNYEFKDKEQLEDEFIRRAEHVEKKCNELGLIGKRRYLSLVNAREFFINYDYNVIYCSVFEAAATSWLYNMNLLAGLSPEYLEEAYKTNSPEAVAWKKYKRPSQWELSKALGDSLNFIIVRHPFARLVSLYWNKFILNTDDKFYKEVGLKIMGRTRIVGDISLQKNGRVNMTREFPPRFEELVKFILCEWKDKNYPDEHWRPITEFCTPCLVPFDFIIKFETLEQEQKVLIERAKLQEALEPRWKEDEPIERFEDLERGFFSELSKRQILDLYEFYKSDFELFEYSIDKYLAYGQDVPLVSLPCLPPQKIGKN